MELKNILIPYQTNQISIIKYFLDKKNMGIMENIYSFGYIYIYIYIYIYAY